MDHLLLKECISWQQAGVSWQFFLSFVLYLLSSDLPRSTPVYLLFSFERSMDQKTDDSGQKSEKDLETENLGDIRFSAGMGKVSQQIDH